MEPGQPLLVVEGYPSFEAVAFAVAAAAAEVEMPRSFDHLPSTMD